MYNFDDAYWFYEGVIDAQYSNWIQKSGSPSYVRPTEPSDAQNGRRGSMVILFGNQEHPIIHGDGVFQVDKERADVDDYPFDYGWIYSCKIQLYNDVYRTDGNNITAVAGGKYGTEGCIIPTFEEWSAMSEPELNAFKNTYFEYPTPTSTSLIGVSIGEYYDVYGWIGCIGRGSDYPTDENFPYYVKWRDITSTLTNGRFDLDYNAETQTSTYKTFDIIFGELFKDVSDDNIKAIVIVTQKQYHMKYWTGYNSSGNMTYTSSTKGRLSDSAIGLSFKLKLCDWKMKADKNNGYPYSREVEAFDFDLLVKPMPFFMWTIKPEENQGYPTLGGKEINVLGAFGNCKKLRTIVIPTTVAEIGEYGFAKTALTAATISSDCHYSETSFPPRCIINYYN